MFERKTLNILTCFDKFKDTLKSRPCGESVIKAFQLKNHYNNYNFTNIPLSDGGEGFLDSLFESDLSLNKKYFQTLHPLKQKFNEIINVPYGYKEENGNHIYIIEMATCCGLELIKNINERNPFHTTTYGLGLLLKNIILNHSINDNIKILMGIGGSCTSDGGLGCLQGLGVINIDKEHYFENIFYGIGLTTLKDINIESDSLIFKYKNLSIDIACDVTNPFIGEKGSVYTFSEQKGAKTKEMRDALENGMIKLAQLFKLKTNIDISNMPGAGAAGGISGSFKAIFNDKISLKKGIEIISNYCHLEKVIKESDLIFTGEGCYDSQSFDGKVVSHVSSLCELYDKPCVIVCGQKKVDKVPNGNCLLFDLKSYFPIEKCMKETSVCITSLIECKLEEILQHNKIRK
ncbi:hypothetical protein ABK040_012335 [Willaertia magna]